MLSCLPGKLLLSSVTILLQPVALGAVFGIVVAGLFVGFKKAEWLPVLAAILAVFWILLPGTGEASSLLLGGTIPCLLASVPALARFLATATERLHGKAD